MPAGRPPHSWTFTYEDLARVSGKSVNAIQRSRSRQGGFDPNDFISVVEWCVRNANPELKVRLITHAATIRFENELVPKKSKRGR